jgi:DnaJ-class molecular chaperone
MLETWHRQSCKCCGGTGTQTRNDGIVIACPMCNGKGYEWVSNFHDLPPGTYWYSGQESTSCGV